MKYSFKRFSITDKVKDSMTSTKQWVSRKTSEYKKDAKGQAKKDAKAVAKFVKENPQDAVILGASYGIPIAAAAIGKKKGNMKLVGAAGVAGSMPIGESLVAARHMKKAKKEKEKTYSGGDDDTNRTIATGASLAGAGLAAGAIGNHFYQKHSLNEGMKKAGIKGWKSTEGQVSQVYRSPKNKAVKAIDDLTGKIFKLGKTETIRKSKGSYEWTAAKEGEKLSKETMEKAAKHLEKTSSRMKIGKRLGIAGAAIGLAGTGYNLLRDKDK